MAIIIPLHQKMVESWTVRNDMIGSGGIKVEGFYCSEKMVPAERIKLSWA